MAHSTKSRAIVLLSGGMDSCVCATLAAQDYEVAALHVSYGQRTEVRERQSFLAICNRLNIKNNFTHFLSLAAKIILIDLRPLK